MGPEHRPEVFRILDLAVQLYPGDFVLQSVGGNLYSEVGRFEAALACRTAALSLRPSDPRARLRSSDALYFMGRTTEAEGGYRALIAQWPQNAEAHYVLGLCRSQMGDFAEALSLLERALALQDNPNWRADVVAAKYYAGHIGRDELVREIERETQPEFVVTLLYPLLDHPQLARRDTAYAVEALARNAASLDTQDWAYLPRTVASIRVGDWAGAAAQLEGRYASPTFLIINPTSMDFVRALVQAKLGQVDRARESYARGAARVEEIVGGNPSAWANSDVARWRRECEDALGL
jgi:tetratricopeptide (TPR) repeat protein